jgi:hypothetical protein
VAHPLALPAAAPSHLQVESCGPVGGSLNLWKNRWSPVHWMISDSKNRRFFLWKKIWNFKTPRESRVGFFFHERTDNPLFFGGGICTRITRNWFGLKPMLADSLILIRTSQFRVYVLWFRV